MMGEIRQSLHYGTYIEHSKSIKLAADENNRAFFRIANKFETEEDRIKGLGLLRSTLMLYAISIELILKAIALYHEKENIKSGEIETFNDFIDKWTNQNRGKGHDFNRLIKYYELSIPEDDLKLIQDLQDYAVWGGRFPFPRMENEIVKLESNNGAFGSSLSLSYIERVEKIIDDQIRKLDK